MYTWRFLFGKELKNYWEKRENVIKYYYKENDMFFLFNLKGDEIHGKNAFKKWEDCFSR